MSIELVLKLSDLQSVIDDYKAGIVDIKETVKRIKFIADSMVLIEQRQQSMPLDS